MEYIDEFSKFNESFTVVSDLDMKVVARKIAKQLGYTRVRYVGSGSYGDSWVVTNGDDKKVLKITTDIQEAKFAEKLRKRGHINHIIDYYDVRKISAHIGETDKRLFKRYDVYSIIMEYVIPVEKHPDYQLIDAIIVFHSESRGSKNGELVNSEYIERKLTEYGYSVEDSIFYINQVEECLKSVTKIGLNPHKVDLHSGNVGYRKEDNSLVLFDISTFDFSWLKLKPIVVT